MTSPAGSGSPEQPPAGPIAERLAAELTGFCVGKLRDQAAQIDRCVRLLSEEQVWERANDVSNSIGNLVLHLTGNVTQWAVAGLGGARFDRDRPAEFARRDPLPTEELLAGLHAAIEAACTALERLSPDDLAAERAIQGRQVSGVAAAVHVTEHFTGHAAQIVVLTKLHTGRDLSLYDEQGRRLDAAARPRAPSPLASRSRRRRPIGAAPSGPPR